MSDLAGALLAVRGLRVGFQSDAGLGYAVDGVDFTLQRGKTLCLVGESGCGKSVTALSLLRLLPPSVAVMSAGSIFFEQQDIATLKEDDLRQIRGNRIGMVFQEPMTSLNPVMRVGDQITEGLRLHKGLKRQAAHAVAVALLEKVGIPLPEERVNNFPHQLSGGMRQRVMIAMALACDPVLIIADEPTTALDVTVQRQILALLRDVTAAEERALLLITHDLGVVAHAADDVAVMYAGRIVEYGPVEELLAQPGHPYTQGLLRSRPGAGPSATLRRLPTIPGTVPGLHARPVGCRFHPRCPHAFTRCREGEPDFFTLSPCRSSRCWLHSP